MVLVWLVMNLRVFGSMLCWSCEYNVGGVELAWCDLV